MLIFVPRTPTPLDLRAIVDPLLGHLRAKGGSGVTRTVGLNLAVLIGIETGHGRQCQNFNVGNVTAGASYDGKAWRPPWFDATEAAADPRLAALHVKMGEGKAPSAFRAYDSLDAGISDFARVLVRDFPEVLEAAKQTDPDVFRRALAQKYSHDYGNVDVTDTIRKLQSELGLVAGAAAPGGGAAGFLVAALFAWWAWARKGRRKWTSRTQLRS